MYNNNNNNNSNNSLPNFRRAGQARQGGHGHLGGTQTGSYQTGSYQKGRFIPPKPKILRCSFDTTPFICLWAPREAPPLGLSAGPDR